MTKFFRVKDYEEAVDCEHCDLVAVRVFTPLALAKVAQDLCYDSPIDGTPITSWDKRREDLKRNDCIPYDPEMHKDAARRRRDRTESFEASVTDTMSTEVAKLPRHKLAQLKKEVVNMGVDLEVKRHG